MRTFAALICLQRPAHSGLLPVVAKLGLVCHVVAALIPGCLNTRTMATIVPLHPDTRGLFREDSLPLLPTLAPLGLVDCLSRSMLNLLDSQLIQKCGRHQPGAPDFKNIMLGAGSIIGPT